ncbi:MAG: 23S rRNA (adenine(2503)-C(2))-methyltransferase [Candidatus Melainabacteria bacterium GWF2_37_15]|nr:MAG: 23S rRNA (adenine(2503)-C(2))-methyltransferase [Candidatus Melainabacteria bacterium GWF2_37_15]
MEKIISTKIVLAGMTTPELEEFMVENNEPKFRAKQLHYWLYRKPVVDFEEMTNLSKEFRKKLKDIAVITSTKIREKLVGKDGTIKYLLEYPDGNVVETVLMSYEKRPNLTACLSTQIGCLMGCVFCATGKNKFIRNLTAREIVEQVMIIQKDTGSTITNLVFMGQGEPLLNYDETVNAIKIINSELEIGMRHITVSTCGIVPNIYRLAEVNRQLNLAISLHAPDHELRKQLMPVENKYNIDEVIKALKFFIKQTRRRITIEYILIGGINDDIKYAKQLNILLKDLKYNINLIPYNPVQGCSFKKPSRESINKFREILEQVNKKVTVRLERGTDIAAACGQLAGIITNAT